MVRNRSNQYTPLKKSFSEWVGPYVRARSESSRPRAKGAMQAKLPGGSCLGLLSTNNITSLEQACIFKTSSVNLICRFPRCVRSACFGVTHHSDCTHQLREMTAESGPLLGRVFSHRKSKRKPRLFSVREKPFLNYNF
jgi:hypothetical protein